MSQKAKGAATAFLQLRLHCSHALYVGSIIPLAGKKHKWYLGFLTIFSRDGHAPLILNYCWGWCREYSGHWLLIP